MSEGQISAILSDAAHCIGDVSSGANTCKLEAANNGLIRKTGSRGGFIRGDKTKMTVRVSWNRKRNCIKKPKFSNKLGEVMSLIQVDFMSVTTPGDAETDIATCRSSGL